MGDPGKCQKLYTLHALFPEVCLKVSFTSLSEIHLSTLIEQTLELRTIRTMEIRWKDR